MSLFLYKAKANPFPCVIDVTHITKSRTLLLQFSSLPLKYQFFLYTVSSSSAHSLLFHTLKKNKFHLILYPFPAFMALLSFQIKLLNYCTYSELFHSQSPYISFHCSWHLTVAATIRVTSDLYIVQAMVQFSALVLFDQQHDLIAPIVLKPCFHQILQ